MSKQKVNNSGASEIFVSGFLPAIGYLLYFSDFAIAATTEVTIGLLVVFWTKNKYPTVFHSVINNKIEETHFPWLSSVIPTVTAILICIYRGNDGLTIIGTAAGIFILMLLGAYASWTKWATILLAAPIAFPIEIFSIKVKPELIESSAVKKDINRGNEIDGWDISPGLKTHPITLICSEKTAEKIRCSLTAHTNDFLSLFSSEKVQWKELESFLENYRKSNKEVDEIEHLEDYNAELLYNRDAGETGNLLRYYFDSV